MPQIPQTIVDSYIATCKSENTHPTNSGLLKYFKNQN
jgi:hypothetical protein